MTWGANIIHIAACHPTQTGVAPDLFARAVKQCQDNNILIVAPGGNDKGECWCIPAIIPGVLTVGAMRDDGQPFKFSNYGGDYQNKGVMANGENILGATPGTDEPKDVNLDKNGQASSCRFVGHRGSLKQACQ